MADSNISGPLYFFDQSPRIQCRKRARRSINSPRNHSIHPPLESKLKSIRPKSGSESAGDGEISGEGAGKIDGKGQGDVLADANEQSSITDERDSAAPSASQLEEMCGESSLLEEYQLTAPQLLQELEKLLKKCRGREDGFFPQGLTNVLNYTWQDLTAGAVHFYGRQRRSCADKIIKLRKPKSVTSDKLSADTTREKTANIKKKMKKKINVEEKLPQESGSLRSKPTISSGYKCWTVQSEDVPSDDPQWTALCRWAVERLQQAQIPINEQNAKLVEQGFGYPLVLRHYGDSQRDWASRQRRGLPARPLPPYCRPPVPEPRGDEPAPLKLHYRINDGTSFLYYASGHVAVCQALSGSPGGGFSTIVFGDGPRASILATFTPFGHATVTHQISGALTMWDQHGGVAYHPSGAVIREWTWSSGGRRGRPITVEVTELISVRASNAASATLWFRADRERIQLSVSCLPNVAPEKNTEEVRSSAELIQLEAEMVEAELGKRWGVDEELRRLQRSVRNILEGWFEYYRQATGISQSTVKTRPACSSHSKPKSQSAALPSLGLKEVCQSPEGSADQLETGRTLSPELQQSKELLPHVTETGVLRVHSNVRLEPVPIPRGSDRGRPAALASSPCPAVMRAALAGQEVPQQCRCSNRRTPLLTDLEYDTFVKAQSTNEGQILVVCVTPPAPPTGDALDQLYKAKNKNRSMPCTQCQQDSFRLLRYELPTADSPSRTHNAMLHRKNNIAPGMFLMYAGGQLLFADHIFDGYSCSAKDLHKQIAKTQAAYCKGLSLPSDFRFSPPLEALQGPIGNGAKSAERHNPQTPLRSRKEIPETYDRSHPAQDLCAPLTLRRSLQEQAKRTLPVTLPILPTEQSLHRAGLVTLAPGFISDR